jgi:Flp pilus assembly protein TadG
MSPVARLRRHGRGQLVREDGVALVEFALVLPLLLLLVLGVIDFGKAFNYKNDETHLANQAARYAAVNSCAACTAASQTINQWTPTQAASSELQAPGALTVNIAFADINGKFPGETGYNGGSLPAKNHCATQPVKVTLTYDYAFMPYLKLGTFTIKGSSTMRLEQNWGDATGQYRPGIDAYTVTPTASASSDPC